MTKKILTCLLLCLIVSLSFVTINKVSADSGWDTGYDGGGSWSSSSSSGRSSGWSGDRSSNNKSNGLSSSEIFFVGLIVGAAIVIGGMKVIKEIKNYRRHNSKNQKELFTDPKFKEKTLDDVVVKNRDYQPEEAFILHDKPLSEELPVDKEEFANYAYDIFVKVQEAWMNFDYDALRNYLSDELYNQYKMQLETLKAKNEKNIMLNFKCLGVAINSYENINNKDIIEVILYVRFNDFVVNENDEVVRGDRNARYQNTYILTFERNIVDDKTCPKCGNKLDGDNSNMCPYCRTIIKLNNKDFVMSKKVKVDQDRVRN